jgi:hypothetical protein
VRKQRAWIIAIAAGALATALAVPAVSAGASTSAPAGIRGIDCSNTKFLCTEINQSDEAFGHYVGHDEPSLLFDSNVVGSGNQMQYSGVLPVEPSPTNVPGKHTYDFQNYAVFWFGMAMCDTQSYPNTVKSCVPDSNANIAKAGSPYHPGAAYMELQFYPPGYVQQWNGFSCSATQWCVALTIDSYSNNPLTQQSLNTTCQAKTGIEYVNFAYLTKSGKPQGPPNPINFDPLASGTPNPSKVAFLNQGDHYTVTLHDTTHGLQTVVDDTTSGVVGGMTASAENGFGQVKFAPTGTSCTNIPYDFHPMYSTSSPQTTVPWAAATYNVAIDTEIGHFDYCTKVDPVTGSCVGLEGGPGNREPTDSFDDVGCFPGSASGLIKIGGCLATNIWTSPKTGAGYNIQYAHLAFNTDLPAIEQSLSPACNGATGAHCTRLPVTDDGMPAQFYPYYSTGLALGGCAFTIGQNVPGFSTNDFGKLAQYGSLLKVTYPELGGTTASFFNDFQQTLPSNPCPAP